MDLTWKDGAATLLSAGTVLYLVSILRQWDWALSGNYRLLTGLLLAVGLGMCILSSSAGAAPAGVYGAVMGGLGGLAFLAAILGFIFGTQFYVLALGGIIVLMWMIATINHAI